MRLLSVRGFVGEIPEPGENVSEQVADNRGHDDKHQGVTERKRVDVVLEIKEMEIEYPVHELLGHSREHHQRPNRVPDGKQSTERQSHFMRV